MFERLALPGLDRGARFDLLATLGRLGVYDLRAGALGFGGNDSVTLAAKRMLGIGDPMLLERRAADLAEACGLPLEALDVGCSTGSGAPGRRWAWRRTTEPDPPRWTSARAALGLD